MDEKPGSVRVLIAVLWFEVILVDLDRYTVGFLAVVAALGVAAGGAVLAPGSRAWFTPDVTAAAH